MRDRKWDFCWARLRIIALDFWRLSRIVGKTILLTGALPTKIGTPVIPNQMSMDSNLKT